MASVGWACMLGRVASALVLVALLAFSGCLSSHKASAPPMPPVLNVPASGTSRLPAIPPCALAPMQFTVPAGDGAEVPAAPVQATLKTDAYGVTHIYADSAYALFYANGYVQARDRLFQMDVLRHVGYGDSASVIGPAQLASDAQVARDLYTKEEMQAQLAAASPQMQQVLQAYSDGVDRYIAEATARNTMPAEFVALGHAPEQWTPLDSVSVIDYLIGHFGVAGGSELGNAQRLDRLDQTLGPDEAWKAFADLDGLQAIHTYTTIPVADKQVNGCEVAPGREEVPAAQMTLAAAAAAAMPVGMLPEAPDNPPVADEMDGVHTGLGILDGFHWGSNALVVDGSHTTTGKPIMFGAPQMGYFKPPVPYQIGLHGAGYDAAGIGVTGAPGIVIGRNADLTWSVTSGIDDEVDTIAVPIDGKGHYTWDGQQRSEECRSVAHQVGPNIADIASGVVTQPATYTQTVCRIEGDPVVAENKEAGLAWIRHTATRNKELGGAWMWLNVARQSSFDGVRSTLASFPFTFNFHVAWDDGIGYLHTGDVPLRAAGFDPRLPVPAGQGGQWLGETYTGGLGTWATDPSTGYYTNWNNAPAYGWRTGDEPQNWGSAHRVQVLDGAVREKLAASGGKLSWQDVADINEMAATRDSYAGHFVPAFIAAARTDPALGPTADALQAWLDAGLPWRDANHDGLYDDAAHAIYDRAIVALMGDVMGDELGDLAPALHLDPIGSSDPHAGDHGRHDNPYSVVADALSGTSAHAWCDDVRSPAAESCQDQLLAALRAAKDGEAKDFGSADVAQWLQPLHYSRFTPIGGSHADLIPMVNRGSWVQVVAVGQGLEQSASSLPPSNSGLFTGTELALAKGGAMPEPDRLTDELADYVAFQYKPFPLTASEVDSVATGVDTLLVPPPLPV
jgi:penicillin amidase